MSARTVLDIRAERIGLAMGLADSNILRLDINDQHGDASGNASTHKIANASSTQVTKSHSRAEYHAFRKPRIWTARQRLSRKQAYGQPLGIRAINDGPGRRVNDPGCMQIDLKAVADCVIWRGLRCFFLPGITRELMMSVPRQAPKETGWCVRLGASQALS
jgi:hypothetical protein